MISFELIDRIQDIISIPFAIFISIMIWKIRDSQIKQEAS